MAKDKTTEQEKKEQCLSMIMIQSENGFAALFRCGHLKGHSSMHCVKGTSIDKSQKEYSLRWPL